MVRPYTLSRVRMSSPQLNSERVDLHLKPGLTLHLVDWYGVTNNPKGRVPLALPVGECEIARRVSRQA